MRIAVIIERYPPQLGGAEIRAYHIATRLAHRGHEVHVFTFHQNKSVQVEQDKGVFVHRFPATGYITKSWGRSFKATLKASLQLATYLSRIKFDVYDFTQFPYFPVLFSRVKPLLVTWLEVWSGMPRPHEDPVISLSSRFLEKITAKKAEFNIAISAMTRRMLIANLDVDPLRAATVPCGVDTEEFQSIHVEKDPNMIAYVGRFAPHKGLDTILEAWKIVSTEDSEACLSLFTVPDDAEFAAIKEKAANLDRVNVERGSRKRALRTLKASRIFVSASLREGFGLAALEAMACGTVPIVVDSPYSATPEVVTDGRTGLVVQPDAASLASAILTLKSDRKLMSKLAGNCRHSVKGYDWEVVASKLESIYSQVIK